MNTLYGVAIKSLSHKQCNSIAPQGRRLLYGPSWKSTKRKVVLVFLSASWLDSGNLSFQWYSAHVCHINAYNQNHCSPAESLSRTRSAQISHCSLKLCCPNYNCKIRNMQFFFFFPHLLEIWIAWLESEHSHWPQKCKVLMWLRVINATD